MGEIRVFFRVKNGYLAIINNGPKTGWSATVSSGVCSVACLALLHPFKGSYVCLQAYTMISYILIQNWGSLQSHCSFRKISNYFCNDFTMYTVIFKRKCYFPVKFQQYKPINHQQSYGFIVGIFLHCTLGVASPREPRWTQVRLMTTSFEISTRVA